ncbi:MAG TPA: ATP-binding protein [Holophagaceae bacterium]|jgi:two-component system cell cycle sensor histidine kinase/response regulator CckA|nr:ATP-binding protein [Holophagaceae bacterium]
MTDLRFLHLEDNQLDGELAEMTLKTYGLNVQLIRVEDRSGFETELRAGGYDLILSDYKLPSFDGVSALELARQIRPEWPFIFVSGTIGEEIAIEAMRLGATDYVLKDRLSRLGPVARRALQETQEQRQRAQAEAALLASAEAQRRLLDAARVVKVAPWSIQAGQLMMSESIRDVLGYDPSEQVRDLHEVDVFIHPEDRMRFRRVVDQPGPSTRSLECRMRKDDGGWVWTRWTFGTDLAQGGVVQDVTEQRRLQDQLFQSQKLESLGALAAGIAHDFKNLLQGLGGHAELMGLRDPLSERQRHSLDAIEHAVERGRALTAKLLAFSRNEPVKKSTVNLNQLLTEVEALLRPSVGTSIRLITQPDPSLPPTQADPHQLHQVLVNLVLNAQAAIEGPGTVTLRTGQTILQESRAFEVLRVPGAYLFVEVEDTGKGIPPEVLPRIFEPFFTTKGEHGTGLGLAVAYGIAESHGGWIDCHSELGHGTRFRIHLPLEAAPIHREPRDPREDREPSGPHRGFRA